MCTNRVSRNVERETDRAQVGRRTRRQQRALTTDDDGFGVHFEETTWLRKQVKRWD